MAFPTPYDYERHQTHSGLTFTEYMAIEEYTERRHEFIYGDMIWLPDITLLHSQVKTNLWMTLRKQFDKTLFNAWGSTLKIEAIKNEVVLYPGVSVARKAIQHPDSYFIQEPILIAEVPAPATEAYDKGEKFDYYKNIPTLQYYLLVTPETPSVWLYSKMDDGFWTAGFYTLLAETIPLPALHTSLSLSDIYED